MSFFYLKALVGHLHRQTVEGIPYTSKVVDTFNDIAHTRAEAETVTDLAPKVKAFGESVKERFPEASFHIAVICPQGQRKPPGFDAATQRHGAFATEAFLAVIEASPAEGKTIN